MENGRGETVGLAVFATVVLALMVGLTLNGYCGGAI